MKTTTGGSYCSFCFGTHGKEESVLENHDFERTIVPESGHNYYVVKDTCKTCGYQKRTQVNAATVVADYYGVVDGDPHTVAVSHALDGGVTVQMRYGETEQGCNLTTPPNFSQAGEYRVWWEATHVYEGVEMVTRGVSNVWLRDDKDKDPDTPGCGCGDPNCTCPGGTGCGCGGNGCGNGCGCNHNNGCATGNHNYTLLEHVNATCYTLGYDRYLCVGCGKIEKRNYSAAIGHAWQSFVTRMPTCEFEGVQIDVCRRCHQMKQTDISAIITICDSR